MVQVRGDKKLVYDEHGGLEEVDRVVFACQCTAVGNMHKEHGWVERTLLSVPEYADDHHPATGHMHAIMHNDSKIIAPEWEQEVLQHASNYVEITRNQDGSLNIENRWASICTGRRVCRPLLRVIHRTGVATP